MAEDRTESRYEIKMPFHALQLSRLESTVRAHFAGFRETYPRRRVNNVYLDTEGLRHYQDNRAGVDDRDKVRIRWYGTSDAGVEAALEIKRRRRTRNSKLVHVLRRPLDLTSGATWTEILRAVREELPVSLLAEVGASWRPILVTRYQRQYFATPDGEVRLTLDHDQELYSQLAAFRPNVRFALPPPHIAVMEVKAPLAARARLEQVTSELPTTVHSNSKYAIAVERAFNA